MEPADFSDGNMDIESNQPTQETRPPPAKAETDSPLDPLNVSESSFSSLVIHTGPPTPSSVGSAGENSDEDNTTASIQTAIRTLRRPQVVYLRPTIIGAQTLKTTSTRVVSLPETVSRYSAKQETARRVVSMPQSKPVHLSPYSDIGEQFGLEGSPARVRVRSVATDLPHTPSPPSSPDSVVFIANKSPLPDVFLRKNPSAVRSRTPEPDEDQDWITWAHSPPRPIPALHGPLSLPYARCPSGAEGTIIEEQGDLPRMIWGLEQNADASNRQRAEDNVPKQPTQAPLKRSARPVSSQQAPPRFSNSIDRDTTEPMKPIATTPSVRHELLTPETEFHMPPMQPQIHAGSPEHYYALPSHGPIDLSGFLRPRYDQDKESDFASNAAWDPLGDNLYHYGSTGAMNWQALLMAQERLKNSLATSLSGSSLADYSRNFGHSGSATSLASSRSPIILAPPTSMGRNLVPQFPPFSSQLTSPMVNAAITPRGPSRRPSALEIAQKYREQQETKRQLQNILPTPPSSSSSLWSSQFSPYQESLLSPEFLSATRLPSIPRKDADAQRLALLQQVEALQQWRPAEQVRPGISERDSQGQVYPSSASQPQGHLNANFDAHLAGPAAPRSLPGGLYVHPQQAPTSSNSHSHSVAPSIPRRAQAPAGPSSPTSTGFGPVGSRIPPRTPSLGSITPVIPPSPASPKSHSRKISQNTPRSIPLARLVQRLSSVPEEETTLPPGKGRVACIAVERRPVASGQHASVDRRTAPATKKAFQSLNDNSQAKKKPVLQGNPSTGRPGSRGRSGSEQPRHSTETKGASTTAPTLSTPKETSSVEITHADPVEDDNGAQEVSPNRGRRHNHRGRGGNRGAWRARKASAVNGPERSQGGLTVRS